MNTLSEIEAAVDHLSPSEQADLLALLTRKVKSTNASAPGADDPFEALIGAFAGAHEATGRKAEELLYGKGA